MPMEAAGLRRARDDETGHEEAGGGRGGGRLRVRVGRRDGLGLNGLGAALYKGPTGRSPGRKRPEVGLTFFKIIPTCRKRKKRNTKQTPNIPK